VNGRAQGEQALGVIGKLFGASSIFNFHIAKFFRVEDLATLQALDKLCVVVPGDNPDLGVPAGGCHRSLACRVTAVPERPNEGYGNSIRPEIPPVPGAVGLENRRSGAALAALSRRL